jgi:hypothetical protein
MEDDIQDPITPFGNPDGARASLEEITKGFVPFSGLAQWGGLSTAENDRSARVIVGRKGSGKTLYLRRLHANAVLDKSLHADSISQEVPTTTNIVKFCQWFPKDVLTEQWREMWRRAILRSLASHLLRNTVFSAYVSPEQQRRLTADYTDILRPGGRGFMAHVSIYSQVDEIINAHQSARDVEKYFNRPSWAELETVIGEVIADCPPMCFYLDAVDEEFGHAPMYWLHCQKGLFYQTMRLLRDSQLGARLHVAISMRDLVLASVYRSEHQTRYRGEPHIRVLTWNRKAIEYFLSHKLHGLDERWFRIQGGNVKSVSTWLGINDIENKRRNVRESLLLYLLRHTRLLPRDIVILGNRLCHALAGQPNSTDLEELIRRTVSDTARVFGNEQITICANELVALSIPRSAAAHGYVETYTAAKEFVRGVADDLKRLISLIGVDRFGAERLRDAQSLAGTLFESGENVFSMLWTNGLIGYVDNVRPEQYVFYSEDHMDEFYLPDKATYVFHPILIDAVGIESVDDRPIVPFATE